MVQDHTRWKKHAGTAGAVLLGVVFLVATYSKAWNADGVGAFIDQIRQEELDFLFSATQVALIALALEAGLGMALLLGVRHLIILLPTAALVVFFLFLTGRNYWLVSQGLREPGSCGCFGSLIERTAAEAFWQDLLLMVPFILLCFWKRPKSRGLPKRRLGLALLMALGVPSGHTGSRTSNLSRRPIGWVHCRRPPGSRPAKAIPSPSTAFPKTRRGSTNRKGPADFSFRFPDGTGRS